MMNYEKTARNLRGQAVFMAQNCRGPAYEIGPVIRALKEGADAIEALLKEKQTASEKKVLVSKDCFTCAHRRMPYNCDPCKDCRYLSVNPGDQDMWEKMPEDTEEPKPSEESIEKSCLNCTHFDTPSQCAPCKNCIRVSPVVRDFWEKDGDL